MWNDCKALHYIYFLYYVKVIFSFFTLCRISGTPSTCRKSAELKTTRFSLGRPSLPSKESEWYVRNILTSKTFSTLCKPQIQVYLRFMSFSLKNQHNLSYCQETVNIRMRTNNCAEAQRLQWCLFFTQLSFFIDTHPLRD